MGFLKEKIKKTPKNCFPGFKVGELFSGVVDAGAWLNEDSVHTSDVADLSNAILATGFPVRRSYDDSSLDTFIKSVQHFKKIRMLGAAAIMGTFVACGRIDTYIEEDIMLWDIAGATAIVKAAGGAYSIEKHDDNKVICSLFANDKLKTSYNMVLK